MKLYVDLETLQLIEAPGFRNPVTALRFKRGDAAWLDVSFLSAGLTPSSIGDPAALEMTFGVKLRNAYASDYLVHATDWTIPAAGEAQVYRCNPSFNTEALDSELGIGSGTELSEINLMGEITWSEGAGGPTSTRTFYVVVENDVNRGTEGTPLALPDPEEWLAARVPAPVLERTYTPPVSTAYASVIMEAGTPSHEILITSKVPGTAGHAIQIAYAAATDKGATDVTVAGTLITVELGAWAFLDEAEFGLSDEFGGSIPSPGVLFHMGDENGNPAWNNLDDSARVWHDGVSKWKLEVNPDAGGTYVAEVESMEDTPHGLEFIAVAPATGQASYEVYGSTVRQVVDAVNGHPQANDMVSALALYETPGNWDVANGVAATSLAGGVNPSPEAASVGQLLRFSTATITTDPPVWYFSVGSGSATEWKPLATQDGEETLSNKTLAAPVISGYTESSLASGTVGAAATLSLDGGTYLTATLTASTACTFTMPPVAIGKSFILLLKQAAATGNGTATFTGVIWNQDGAPVITATAGKMDILTFTSDGVDWFGSCSQGFTPSIP